MSVKLYIEGMDVGGKEKVVNLNDTTPFQVKAKFYLDLKYKGMYI